MNKLTQSPIWQNGLTLQGPERWLKVFQKEERFQAELRLRLSSLFNNPSLFHLPPNMRIEAAWRLAGTPMSTLSIFTYLLAVWKAATIYGPLFPNRGNDDSCQWHLQVTWLASLCRSQEGTASRTFTVGRHVYNTCNTTYTLKDPRGEESGLQAPRHGLALTAARFGKAETSVSTPSHTTPAQPHLHWHSVWMVSPECDVKTLERGAKGFLSTWMITCLGKLFFWEKAR